MILACGDRNKKSSFDPVHDDHGLEALDVLVLVKKPSSELLKFFHVSSCDNQHKVGVTRHIITAHDFGRGSDRLFKAVDDVSPLSFERDQHHHRQASANGFGRHYGDVTFNDAVFAEPFDTTLAGRGRQPNLHRQFLRSNAVIQLKQIENRSVDAVDRFRRSLSANFGNWRRFPAHLALQWH